jgi:hypothetical protein
MCVPAVCYVWSLIMVQQWSLPIDVCHFIWALYFLKVYPTWDVAAGFCKADPKTVKKYVEFMILVVLPSVLQEVWLENNDIDVYAALTLTRYLFSTYRSI